MELCGFGEWQGLRMDWRMIDWAGEEKFVLIYFPFGSGSVVFLVALACS